MAGLTWTQAAAWRFERHHLRERPPAGRAIEVVSRIAGLHAQVMSSAELSLNARVEGLERDAVQRMLWDERSLYKTWAMRGTLHLLPAHERGFWQGAFANYRHHETAGWLNGWGVTAEQVQAVLESVAASLRDGQLTRRELADAVSAHTRDRKIAELVHGSWGSFLKPSAFRGELCFAPSSGQNVRFTNPDTWLGATAPADPDEALRDLVRRYLGAYGPATREDLRRWWGGFTPARAGRILDELAVRVEVDGLEAYLLAEHVEEVAATEPGGTLRLLPAFDPYVAGAPRAGHGIFPARRRGEIYRQAGWLTPVMVVDGRIAGLFRQERRGARLEIAPQPWERLPKREVRAEAARVADWLGLRLRIV